MGKTELDVPEHVRPRFRELANRAESIRRATGEKSVRKPGFDPADIKRLTEIRNALPSKEQQKKFYDKLHKDRNIWDGMYFGSNLKDDKNWRLGRIMERRGIEPSEDTYKSLADDLLNTVKLKPEYDPNNYLFDEEKPGFIDEDAAEYLQIYAMENLAKEYGSHDKLYADMGRDIKEQAKLKKEYTEILAKYAARSGPKEVRKAVVNGQVLGGVERYGKEIDDRLIESAEDDMSRFLYGDQLDRKVLALYAKGYDKSRTIEELRESLGNDSDAEHVLENAFYSEKDSLPSETFVPLIGTPDGNTAYDRRTLQLGVESALYGIELQKRGLKYGEGTAEEQAKIRDLVRKKTLMMTNALVYGDRQVVYRDPDSVLRAFKENEGWRGQLYNFTRAVNTMITLGQKERIMNNLPDRIARGVIALTLPRRAAGILKIGEDEEFLREGELLGPLLGDTRTTNAMDYVLRTFGFVDEPIARSFTMAVDRDAKERNPVAGRGGRIIKYMVENFGTDEHIEYMTEDHLAGGRFLMEFGDAFINPMLGKFGQENPLLGQALGGVAAMSFFLLSPDALDALQVAYTGGKASKVALKRKFGATEQAMIGNAADASRSILSKATEGTTTANRVDNQMQIKPVYDTLHRLASKDKTGAVHSLLLLAEAGTLATHGMAASLKNQSIKTMMGMYTGFGKSAAKAMENMHKTEKALSRAKNKAKRVALGLKSAGYHIDAIRAGLQQNAIVVRSMRQIASDLALQDKLQSTLRGLQSYTQAEFIGDAFRVIRGDGKALDLDSFLNKYKFLDPTNLSKDPEIRLRQIHGMISEEFSKIMRGVSRRAPDVAAELTRKSATDLNKFLDIVAKNAPSMANLNKNLLQASNKLDEYDKSLQELVNAKFPKHTIAALEAKRDVLKGDIAEVKSVAGELSAEIAELQNRQKFMSQISDPAELDKFMVKEFNDFLARFEALADAASRVTDMDPKLFDKVMDATYARGLEEFGSEVLGGTAKVGEELTEASKKAFKKTPTKTTRDFTKGVTRDIYETKTLTKIFNDPFGVVQTQFRFPNFDIGEFFSNPKAYYVYGTIQVSKLFRKFPIFTTNVRFLETTVRLEIDDAAKGASRRARNIMDSINLVNTHLKGQEAREVTQGLLTQTSSVSGNQVFSIASKYKVPFTKPARVEISALAGRRESLVTTMVRRSQDIAAAKKFGRGDEVAQDHGLDAAIKAYISDKGLAGRDTFLAPGGVYELIRNGVYEDLVKLDLDSMSGTQVYKALHDSIVTNITGNNIRLTTGAAETLDTTKDLSTATVQFQKAIVLGAVQQDFLTSVFRIIGPRFSGNMGRMMNYLMGAGQETGQVLASRKFKRDDYVWLRKDAQLFNEAAKSANLQRAVTPEEARKINRPSAEVDPITKEPIPIEPTIVERGVSRQFTETAAGPVRKDIDPDDTRAFRNLYDQPFTETMEAMRRPNIEAKESAFPRIPKFEKLAAEATGLTAYRINRINADGTVELFDLGKGKMVENPVKLEDIVHRETALEIMDGVDGFSIWGMDMLTNVGRKNATEAMGAARASYQKMVAIGVMDGDIRMVPATLLNTFTESLTKIEKELDAAISAKAAESDLGITAVVNARNIVRWWKTSILTGLIVPRPAYFVNQLFGDFSQMFLTTGAVTATSLTLVGSLAYFPVYGKALQDGYLDMMSKMPAGKVPLPSAFSALFCGDMVKILRGDPSMLKGLKGGDKTCGEFRDEMLRAGVDESIVTTDIGQQARDSLRRQRASMPTLFQKLDDAGFDLTYMSKVLMLKIREVQTRQRMLFYSHLRLNKGLTEAEAKRALANTLYDWTHSVGKLEMQYFGRFVLFYTLSKNAMAQQFRIFTELDSVGTKEFGRRYLRGQTQAQRLELTSRVMMAFPDVADPYAEMTPEEKKDAAMKEMRPEYFSEYPFLDFATVSPEGLEIMRDAGFMRTMAGFAMPKATTTEYMTNIFEMSGTMLAMAIAAANIVDPQGNVVPLAADFRKSGGKMIDLTLDQFFVPVYADVGSNILKELIGIQRLPKSEYGRRVKPGDMAIAKLMNATGLGGMVTLSEDPNDPKMKRISYIADPITAPIMSIPKGELRRLQLGLAMVFPGMAPAEIKALAASDETASARLQSLSQLLNVNKAMFFNADLERYYAEKDVQRRFASVEGRLKRMYKSDIVPEK
tara:strand:- start:16266 stop:22790 length:6525 start_codon:yes stop_codon:yes gene_type:complete